MLLRKLARIHIFSSLTCAKMLHLKKMNTCRSCTKFFYKLVISFAESSCLTDIPKLPRSALLKKEFKFVLFYLQVSLEIFADNRNHDDVLLWSNLLGLFSSLSAGVCVSVNERLQFLKLFQGKIRRYLRSKFYWETLNRQS